MPIPKPVREAENNPIQQIARRVDVSPSTVLRVLNGDTKGVYPKIARRNAKIRRIADELNYRPNAAAKATASGRFNSVSLVIGAQFGDPGCGHLPRGLMQGVQMATHDARLLLNIAALTDEEMTDDHEMPHILRHWCSDGMLMNYSVRMPSRIAEVVNRHRIPTVYLNVKRQADSVYLDDQHAGHEATRHLIEMGHRRIVYLGPIDPKRIDYPEYHYSAADRAAGYVRAMNEAGLAPRSVDDPSLWGRAFLPERWPEVIAHRPTALVVYGGDMALRAMQAAGRSGLRVPEDLSIVSMFDDRGEGNSRQPFSGVVLPFMEIGRAAVQMLQDKIAKPDRPIESRGLRGQWDAGQSCAPPNRRTPS